MAYQAIASKTCIAGRPVVSTQRGARAVQSAPRLVVQAAAAQAKTKSKAKAQSFKVTVPGVQSKSAEGIPVSVGFTKENELFVGRVAMLGFAAALVGEIYTGKGPIGQLGFDIGEGDFVVVAVAALNLLAAFFPASGKFVPEETYEDRKVGSLQDPKVSLVNPGKFFGISGIGFTKANELFVGRVAQLGFAACLIGERLTGKGPLTQLKLETGIPLTESEPLLLAFIVFFFLASITEGTGKFEAED